MPAYALLLQYLTTYLPYLILYFAHDHTQQTRLAHIGRKPAVVASTTSGHFPHRSANPNAWSISSRLSPVACRPRSVACLMMSRAPLG